LLKETSGGMNSRRQFQVSDQSPCYYGSGLSLCHAFNLAEVRPSHSGLWPQLAAWLLEAFFLMRKERLRGSLGVGVADGARLGGMLLVRSARRPVALPSLFLGGGTADGRSAGLGCFLVDGASAMVPQTHNFDGFLPESLQRSDVAGAYSRQNSGKCCKLILCTLHMPTKSTNWLARQSLAAKR